MKNVRPTKSNGKATHEANGAAASPASAPPNEATRLAFERMAGAHAVHARDDLAELLWLAAGAAWRLDPEQRDEETHAVREVLLALAGALRSGDAALLKRLQAPARAALRDREELSQLADLTQARAAKKTEQGTAIVRAAEAALATKGPAAAVVLASEALKLSRFAAVDFDRAVAAARKVLAAERTDAETIAVALLRSLGMREKAAANAVNAAAGMRVKRGPRKASRG